MYTSIDQSAYGDTYTRDRVLGYRDCRTGKVIAEPFYEVPASKKSFPEDSGSREEPVKGWTLYWSLTIFWVMAFVTDGRLAISRLFREKVF